MNLGRVYILICDSSNHSKLSCPARKCGPIAEALRISESGRLCWPKTRRQFLAASHRHNGGRFQHWRTILSRSWGLERSNDRKKQPLIILHLQVVTSEPRDMTAKYIYICKSCTFERRSICTKVLQQMMLAEPKAAQSFTRRAISSGKSKAQRVDKKRNKEQTLRCEHEILKVQW